MKSTSARCFLWVIAFCPCLGGFPEEACAGLSVVTDFPGGSGDVLSIDREARMVRITPTPGPGWDSWWYVRIEGIRPGEEIALEVSGGFGGDWGKPDRAFFRASDGEWRRTGPGEKAEGRITYRETIDAEHADFAWGEPFGLADAEVLVDAAAAGPHAEGFVLAESAEGRPVPALRVSEPGASESERWGIWIQARQHAWESGSSWVARGFTEWLISDDPAAKNLRRGAVVVVVPIMDVDNVERGAGGKDQNPHDHNRDWTDDPHWPEVRAAQKEIATMAEAGRLDVFVDLHNPGPGSRNSFFYVVPDSWSSPERRARQSAFLAAAEEKMTGPLPYVGRKKVSSTETTARSWVFLNTTNGVVSHTLEIPWNSPDSVSENYRNVGRQLGLAIEECLFNSSPLLRR